ncbi:MAG TPA: DUF3566 domain-containing protein [Acidimicrobiia bacterium]|nr:DUF3566 domain-containing protein [Acidimicrobiia bacterium]
MRRIVRKIDPWTVLKASLVFNTVSGLTFILGIWVMWSIAVQRGIPDGIADIFESLTLTITPDGELYFRALLLLTIIMVVVATAAMTLGAVLYNLISDLVGGIEVTVLEESYLPPQQGRRPLHAPIGRPQPAIPPAPAPMVPATRTAPSSAAGNGSDAGSREPRSAASPAETTIPPSETTSPGKVGAPST